MKTLFNENMRLKKTLQIHKKRVDRLERDRQADRAMWRHTASLRPLPWSGQASDDGNAIVGAINAFLRGRSTVSPTGFAAFMKDGNAPATLADVARYLDESQGKKMHQLPIGFFTPLDCRARLKNALQPIILHDVSAHPSHKDEYIALENTLTPILQSAIDGHIDYDDARKECRQEVKKWCAASNSNHPGERLTKAVDRAFHEIREGIDRHEDALYALNAFLPDKPVPACREFIVSLRHDNGRMSDPFCFLCDEESGQWFVIGGPGRKGHAEPRAVTPRAYFNEMIHGDGKHAQVLGIEVLVPDEPFNPLIRLQKKMATDSMTQ